MKQGCAERAFRLCFRKTAWGACKILNADGSEDTSVGSLGWANPIRYRGYYYDNSLGLYYLTTRYYDPETGRFTSADDSSYLAPDTINGLNLYAYCGNNPVMNVDPNGNFFLALFVSLLVGAAIGGVAGGISAQKKGESMIGGVFSGALVGAALGLSTFLGGASMLLLGGKAIVGLSISSTVGKLGLATSFFATSTITSTIAGMGDYAIETISNQRAFDSSEMIREGMTTSLKGTLNFVTGMALGFAGGYNNLLTKMPLGSKFKLAIARSMTGTTLQFGYKKVLN